MIPYLPSRKRAPLWDSSYTYTYTFSSISNYKVNYINFMHLKVLLPTYNNEWEKRHLPENCSSSRKHTPPTLIVMPCAYPGLPRHGMQYSA